MAATAEAPSSPSPSSASSTQSGNTATGGKVLQGPWKGASTQDSPSSLSQQLQNKNDLEEARQQEQEKGNADNPENEENTTENRNETEKINEEEREEILQQVNAAAVDARDHLLHAEKLAKEIRPPSYWLHLVRMQIAGAGDGLDIAAVFFEGVTAPTGVGPFIVALLDAGVDVILDVMLSLTEILIIDKQKKKLNEFSEFMQTGAQQSQATFQSFMTLAGELERAQQEMGKQWRERSTGGAQRLGKAKVMQARHKLEKFASNKLVVKIGWLRGLTQQILDLIPFVELIPWRVYGVFSRYRAHKRMHHQIMEQYREFVLMKQEEIAIAEQLAEETMQSEQNDLRMAA